MTPEEIAKQDRDNRDGLYGPLCGTCFHGKMCHAAAEVNGPRTGACYGLGRTLYPNHACQCKAFVAPVAVPI